MQLTIQLHADCTLTPCHLQMLQDMRLAWAETDKAAHQPQMEATALRLEKVSAPSNPVPPHTMLPLVVLQPTTMLPLPTLPTTTLPHSTLRRAS